jgi:hypothetical protein
VYDPEGYPQETDHFCELSRPRWTVKSAGIDQDHDRPQAAPRQEIRDQRHLFFDRVGDQYDRAAAWQVLGLDLDQPAQGQASLGPEQG